MLFHIITMFPEFFDGPLGVSIVGRARETGALEVDLVDLRDYGLGRHRQLDDAPFGGGAGMVMMVEPLAAALDPLAGTHRIVLGPAGTPLTQEILDRLASMSEVTIVCGRFEGIDQRVIDNLADELENVDAARREGLCAVAHLCAEAGAEWATSRAETAGGSVAR